MAAAMLVAHLGIKDDEVSKYTESFLPIITGADLTFEEQTSMHTYRVISGDNLYRIAQANACSVHDLMGWNQLNSTKLRINQRLKIQVTERVAVYPDVVTRKIDPVLLLPTITYTGISGRSHIFHSPVLTSAKTHRIQVPKNSIVLRKRMSVADAIRINSEEETPDISSASFRLALPGYVVILED